MRLIVLGPGAAGKSTFARRLGEITGTPVIELDSVFWSENLEPLSPQDWVRVQRELIADDAWILDGDLGPHDVLRPRLERADTVVMFDPPRLRCVWRALRRSREQWGFWVWLLSLRWRERPRLLSAIEQHAAEARLVIVTNDAQVERLLAEFG